MNLLFEYFNSLKPIPSPSSLRICKIRENKDFFPKELFFRISAGRLFDYLCLQSIVIEQKIAKYTRQLLDGVNYLHQCRIVHLDIQVILHCVESAAFIFHLAGKSVN